MQPRTYESRKRPLVNIASVDPQELQTRIHEAVARRAYQLFEGRGALPGHELEDWRRAESEVVHSLGCGLVTHDEKISVSTDTSLFDEGSMQVCIEPLRLSICGRPHADKVARGQCPSTDFFYRFLSLPAEVDPSRAKARWNGRILEIDLYRIHPLKQVA
jgi:HSP20 family molecular chaperone IbpA